MISYTVIKTEYIVDDAGRNFDDGRVHRKPLFLVSLPLEKARERLKEGRLIYFIYPNFLDGKYGRKVCHSDFYLTDQYKIFGDFCGERASIKKLTVLEHHVVDILAARSGMDSWFSLEGGDGRDYVRDLETGLVVSLKEGINSLYSGLTCLDNYGLSKAEMKTAETLFERFGCTVGGI